MPVCHPAGRVNLTGLARNSAAGGAVQIVADASGCRSTWCVHMTLIKDRPHNPNGLSAQPDYALIDAAHPVATSWLARTNFGAP